MDNNNNNRRNFLKIMATFGLATAVSPLNTVAANTTKNDNENIIETTDKKGKKITTISILQTTDVHCQIHPHDELFWENEKAVFRKTGGYAYIAAMLADIKKKNANTFIIDTGDMFQGSELSVKTTGKAFVPILNAMNYDLYLPGNWEVIYGKKICKL